MGRRASYCEFPMEVPMRQSMRALRVRSAALSVNVLGHQQPVFSRQDVRSSMHFSDAVSRKAVTVILGQAVRAGAVRLEGKGWGVVSERRLSAVTLSAYQAA